MFKSKLKIIAVYVWLSILIIGIFVVAAACEHAKQPQTEIETTVVAKQSGGYAITFELVTLDGHEYWVYDGSYAGGIVHSASCPCHTKN